MKIKMVPRDELKMRTKALKIAVLSHGKLSSATIVGAAGDYYDFLVGEEPQSPQVAMRIKMNEKEG